MFLADFFLFLKNNNAIINPQKIAKEVKIKISLLINIRLNCYFIT